MSTEDNIGSTNNSPLGDGGERLSFIIAGGGTGGHIFPAIAIANAIKKLRPGVEIFFVGAKGKMEMEKVPQAGYPIEGLDIAGFNRSSLIKNISLPFKLMKSFAQVNGILKRIRPAAVIGVGGYSSFPVLRMAQRKRIPTFIHESNSFAGKSNIMLGKKATKIFTASDGMEKFFPKGKIVMTGNPVRTAISQSTITREEGINFFGLDPAKPTVLSIGGSLGAKSINEAISAHIGEFEKNGLQLIWQTGKPYAEQGKKDATGKKNIWVSEFITQMEYAYAAADFVISRSGAMAIAELCVMGKASIFVPYPHAAEDHQKVNATNLLHKFAGMMVTDDEAKDKLVEVLIGLSKDEVLQSKLRANIAKLGISNADEIIATEILKAVKK